jgi:hypothetical protein
MLSVQFANNTFFHIHDGHSSGYVAELANATFCIAPPGFALWSPRLSEAVIAGCIPVVIGDGIELPFEELIDYASFVVHARSSSTIGTHCIFLNWKTMCTWSGCPSHFLSPHPIVIHTCSTYWSPITLHSFFPCFRHIEMKWCHIAVLLCCSLSLRCS